MIFDTVHRHQRNRQQCLYFVYTFTSPVFPVDTMSDYHPPMSVCVYVVTATVVRLLSEEEE